MSKTNDSDRGGNPSKDEEPLEWEQDVDLSLSDTPMGQTLQTLRDYLAELEERLKDESVG
jgi:hypothetical protein